MSKCINLYPFIQGLFDETATAIRAAEIGQAILAAQLVRMTDIVVKMKGKQCGQLQVDPALCPQSRSTPSTVASFSGAGRICGVRKANDGDPTEIERPQAWKTEYVGTLKDGKTKGFWALVLATSYRGRAIPCGLVMYSSKTIAAELDSRNLNHFRAFEGLKDLLGKRPLVLDREFNYLELVLNQVAEQVNFVIRLKLGRHAPKFWDSDGREVALTISPGETVPCPSSGSNISSDCLKIGWWWIVDKKASSE